MKGKKKGQSGNQWNKNQGKNREKSILWDNQ